jgi:release factor glutamine methyltransferase
MNKNQEIIFAKFRDALDKRLTYLTDKPEENAESTLKALWLKAYGTPTSAKKALNEELPELSEIQLNLLEQLVEKRISNTPLAHLTNRQNFLNIEFISDHRALIPREETEILGKKVLKIVQEITQNNSRRVMDICCGCGNLGLAAAFYNPNVTVLSSDLSHDAVELAKENASFLKLESRVQIEQGDLFGAFDYKENHEQMDLVICNPPYISTAKVQKMNSEIAENEPQLAFDGGMLGTKIIQRLIREAPLFLKPSAWLAFEVGLGQGKFVYDLCTKSELYTNVEFITDKEQQIRVIVARK